MAQEPHAEKKAQYEQDARWMAEPWTAWECNDGFGWYRPANDLHFYLHVAYRRRPDAPTKCCRLCKYNPKGVGFDVICNHPGNTKHWQLWDIDDEESPEWCPLDAEAKQEEETMAHVDIEIEKDNQCTADGKRIPTRSAASRCIEKADKSSTCRHKYEPQEQKTWKETIVKIRHNGPDDPGWLCGDNIAVALHAHCVNTDFQVTELNEPKPEELTRELSIEIAARIWCDQEMGHIEMDTDKALRIAEILREPSQVEPKPRTIRLDAELPEPMREEPEINTQFYIVDINSIVVGGAYYWCGSPNELRLLRSGRCHRTATNAEAWLAWWKEQVVK